MRLDRVLEQHIAVFGESGSGKTVLVSSFYGGMQEPHFLKASLFDVTADDAGQGHRLHANYLGMKDSARQPAADHFSSTAYAFSVKPRNPNPAQVGPKQFDALRIVWHDYPGEWFEKDVNGPDEGERRVETFKALLGSDVALLLVDGQRLLDNAGEEERYLRSLLGSFRTGLLGLRDQLLEDGKPLARFPRIWILALSKADLLPEFDVFRFRDLVIGRASDDLSELRHVLEGLVDSPTALAVGEDFVLLSSAKFEPNKIEVTERIGVDLVLPLAAMLPLERHVRWVEKKQMAGKVAEDLWDGIGPLLAMLAGKAKIRGTARVAKARRVDPKLFLASLIGRGGATLVKNLGVDHLKKLNAEALAKRDYMKAVLTRFGLDLEEGEEKGILLRSRR
jgi:hypothetical protein